MQTATCQEEMPSLRQVQPYSRAQGEEATAVSSCLDQEFHSLLGAEIQAGLEVSSLSWWSIPKNEETSLRSVNHPSLG